MGDSQYITTYQIDEADYTYEYGQMLLDGCRLMYPGKNILASIEIIRNQVLMSVYATDIEDDTGRI